MDKLNIFYKTIPSEELQKKALTSANITSTVSSVIIVKFPMNTLKTKLLRLLLAVVLAVSLVPCADLLGEKIPPSDEERQALTKLESKFSSLKPFTSRFQKPVSSQNVAKARANFINLSDEALATLSKNAPCEIEKIAKWNGEALINYFSALNVRTPTRTNVAQNINNLLQLQQLDPLLNENNSNEPTENGATAQGGENHSSFQNQGNGEQQQIENQQQLQQQPEKEKEEEEAPDGNGNGNDSANSPQRHTADQQQQQGQQQPDDIAVSSNSDDETSNRSQQPQVQNQENGPDISSPNQSEDTSAGPEEEKEEEGKEYSDSDENSASHREEEEEEASGQNDNSDSDNSPQRHIADQQQQQRSEDIAINSDSDDENSNQPQQNQPRQASTFQAPLPTQQQFQ